MLAVPPYQDLIGKPFVRGARGPDAFDCYGLVLEMYRRAGITAPDFISPGNVEAIADLIEAEATKWRRVDPKTPGASVLFRVEGVGAHVGFMIDTRRFIHCIEPNGVCREWLSSPVWSNDIIAAYIYE